MQAHFVLTHILRFEFGPNSSYYVIMGKLLNLGGHNILTYKMGIKHSTLVVKDKCNHVTQTLLCRDPTKGSKMGSHFYYLH